MTDRELIYLQKILMQANIERCKFISSWLIEYIQTLEADSPIYKLPIQQLHLSTRTFNILQSNKITTIGKLLKEATDWDNIRQLNGAGKKVLDEIKEKVIEIKEGKIRLNAT